MTLWVAVVVGVGNIGGAFKDFGEKNICKHGAILSFVFNTPGKVLDVLGKNLWPLIMAAVIFVFEYLKSGC